MASRLALVLLALSIVSLGALFLPFSTCAEMKQGAEPGGGVSEGTRLLYRFQEGEVHRYRMVTESDQRQDIGPFQKSVHETRFTQRVLEVQGEVATLEIVYESVRVDVQAGPQSFSFDSSTGTGNVDDVQKKLFSALVDQPCTIRLQSDGTVLEVSGFDAPFDRLARELEDHPFADQIVASQKATFGNEAMKETFKHSLVRLPEGELRVGAQWSGEEIMRHPIGELRIRSVNKLLRFGEIGGHRCAHISQTSTADLVRAEPARFGGAVFEHSLESATLTAEHDVAPEAGLLVRSESEVSMSLQVRPVFDEARDPQFAPPPFGVITTTKVLLELML